MKRGMTQQMLGLIIALLLVAAVLFVFGPAKLSNLAKGIFGLSSEVLPEDELEDLSRESRRRTGQSDEDRIQEVTMTESECEGITSCSDYERTRSVCNSNPCGLDTGCYFDNDVWPNPDDCLSCSEISRCKDYGHENEDSCNDNPCGVREGGKGCFYEVNWGIIPNKCLPCFGNREC